MVVGPLQADAGEAVHRDSRRLRHWHWGLRPPFPHFLPVRPRETYLSPINPRPQFKVGIIKLPISSG